MRKLKLIFTALHFEEHGAMKQTVEAVLVGLAMVSILFAAVVMFNGGVISQQAPASSSQASNQISSKPGSMMANIVGGDKVSDGVTRGLNNLKDKVGNGPGNQPSNTDATPETSEN